MSKILNAVTAKINQLDDCCTGIDTKICFNRGHTDFVEIPVPPTDVARALLRALLVEIGRDEQDTIMNQLQTFESIACKGFEKSDFAQKITGITDALMGRQDES